VSIHPGVVAGSEVTEMSVQEEVRKVGTARLHADEKRAPRDAVTYGSWMKRATAHQIDVTISGTFAVVAYILVVVATSGSIRNGYVSSLLLFLAMMFAAYGVAITFYNRCVLVGLTGQSWGKKFVGLTQVSELTGEPIGVGNAIIRDMAHAADFVSIGLGFIAAGWDRKRQTFADKIVRSVVIETPRIVQAGNR
jgi:uncharacterized RDD family membrane protein YckC